MSEIHEITEYIAAEYLPGTAAAEIDPSYDLFENGVVHSLQLLRLIDWLRSRYDIPADELAVSPDSFRSVSAIAELVTRARRPAAVD